METDCQIALNRELDMDLVKILNLLKLKWSNNNQDLKGEIVMSN